MATFQRVPFDTTKHGFLKFRLIVTGLFSLFLSHSLLLKMHILDYFSPPLKTEKGFFFIYSTVRELRDTIFKFYFLSTNCLYISPPNYFEKVVGTEIVLIQKRKPILSPALFLDVADLNTAEYIYNSFWN